ncbi:MAG: hypothetical protein HY809_07795 [Nitrospirae bacterium]|nr:hypothetical protein [Nitrospirota bacterium]
MAKKVKVKVKEFKRGAFKDTFTRLFSVITVIFSILFFTKVMEPPFKGAESLMPYLFFLGLHGVITNPYEAGSVRKALCHASLLAALILLIYACVLFFRKMGLIGSV